MMTSAASIILHSIGTCRQVNSGRNVDMYCCEKDGGGEDIEMCHIISNDPFKLSKIFTADTESER